MCVVSMIGDHYRDKWAGRDYLKPAISPWAVPDFSPMAPTPYQGAHVPTLNVTRAEFDALKREVEELKELLKRAKAYDEANAEPDCEVDEKMDLLRRVAALVGIELNDVIKPAI